LDRNAFTVAGQNWARRHCLSLNRPVVNHKFWSHLDGFASLVRRVDTFLGRLL